MGPSERSMTGRQQVRLPVHTITSVAIKSAEIILVRNNFLTYNYIQCDPVTLRLTNGWKKSVRFS